MGGGLMQLVAYGAQDIYLTGNPQITFFKVVYRRHTNFAVEAISQTMNGSVGFGNKTTCTLSRNGDLITNVVLEIDLTKCHRANITRKLGFALIDSVELECGGQKIDKQYGHWMNIWSELTTSHSRRSGLSEMVNDYGDTQHLSVPLQFWFNRNPGLALPLIALQYHELKLQIQWATAADLGWSTSESPVVSCEIFVDYIYLDTDERRRFAQVSHEYLIEQVNMDKFTKGNTSLTLNFNHPVKELIWVSRDTGSGKNTGINFFNYARDPAGTAQLKLNGHDRHSVRMVENFFSVIQPFQVHTTCPTQDNDIGRWMYSNTLSAPNADLTANSKVYKMTGDKTDEVSVGDNVVGPGGGQYIVVNVAFAAAAAGDAGGGETTITFGTGLAKEDAYNSTDHVTAKAANAQNHHLVYKPVRHFANHNNGCINVYSFALKPEEHQPSGTCNFSRIDNSKLILSRGATTTNHADLEVLVYAVNYNVLRIMSGMGGLAYSN